jgi:AraC-like DNA-binding protein
MVCRELKITDKNISEIAYKNGFENISHFNRVFKSIKEISPRQYRSTIS